MRKRRSAKLPSKYVGYMKLDHAPRRAVELISSIAENIGRRKSEERDVAGVEKTGYTCILRRRTCVFSRTAARARARYDGDIGI